MNDYHPNVAAIERSKSVLEQLQKHVEKEPWEARRDRLRTELATGGDYRVKNDLATTLAHTGEATEAVALLEQVEAEKPGLYMTAANLGTAYELAGNNEKAIEWIRKGIERNAAAHEGTEWLHVRILEAKLALQADPAWLDSHSILGFQKVTQTIEFSVTGNRGEKLSIDQVKTALMYQLHERMQFVKPPDPVVGALLLDLGELLAQEPPGLGAAKDVLDLSYLYLHGVEHVTNLQEAAAERSESAERAQMSHGHGVRQPFSLLAYLGIAGVVLAVASIWIKRRLES